MFIGSYKLEKSYISTAQDLIMQFNVTSRTMRDRVSHDNAKERGKENPGKWGSRYQAGV